MINKIKLYFSWMFKNTMYTNPLKNDLVNLLNAEFKEVT